MASRVDTATRHKREQRCYSFMHIYIYLLLLCLARESIPLIGGPVLASFSGNGGAKFSKKIRFLNEASPPRWIRPVANLLV